MSHKEEWKFTTSKNGVKQISSSSTGNVCRMWGNKHTEANAHLIASAPAMYAMIEELTSELHKAIDEVNDQRLSRVNSQTETPPDLWDGQTLHGAQLLLKSARGE